MAFCTSCGTPRASEADRFCRSCGRLHDPVGTPTSGDTAPLSWDLPTGVPSTAVPPQAGYRTAMPPGQPPASPTLTGPPPTAPPPMGPPLLGPPPTAPPSQWQGAPPPGAPPGQGGSSAKVVAVVGVVIALVAAGVVGWQFFWPRGGAASPEEAVEQLMLSAAGQDPVGMLDMLSPAEVEGLDDVYDTARDRAEEEGLIEGDGITDALDVELSELEFDVDDLGDDLARVTLVGGRYDVSWDPDKLPERLDFLAEESEDDSASGDLADAFDGDEPYVTTVRIDGRWYVTMLGSVADVAYQDGEEEADEEDFDLAEPDYDLAGEDVDPITGEDPEEVLDNLVEAVNDGSFEDLLANFPEDLARPLRPYVPVIQSLQEEAGWGSEIGLEVGVEDLELSTERLDGDKVKVVIDQGTFYASAWEELDDDATGTMTVDGDCVTLDEGFGPETECLSDDPTLEDLGIDEFFFVVTEVDGGFQLDPLATAVEYGAILVDSLSADMIEDIVEDLEDDVDAAEEF